MIATQERYFTDAIQEFHQTLTLIGIKETINALKSGRDKVNKEDDESKVNLIKDTIVEIFGDGCFELKKEDVNKSARCLLAYNLKKIGVKNVRIASLLRIHRNGVCNLVNFINRINLVNPKVPIEISIKKAQDKINEKLNNN